MKALKDEPEDVFRMIMCRAYAAIDSPTDYNMVLNMAASYETKRQRDFSKLFNKGREMIDILVRLYAYQAYQHSALHPSDLAQCQYSSWGIIKPILEMGHQALLFFGSPCDYSPRANPNVDSNDLNPPRPRLTPALVRRLHEGKGVYYHKVTNAVLNIASDRFEQHLLPVIQSLGTTSADYTHANHSYREGVLEDIAAKVDLEDSPELYSSNPQLSQTWRNLRSKVHLVLHEHIMIEPGIREIEGGYPLPSPNALVSYMSLLNDLKPTIELVSLPTFLYEPTT